MLLYALQYLLHLIYEWSRATLKLSIINSRRKLMTHKTLSITRLASFNPQGRAWEPRFNLLVIFTKTNSQWRYSAAIT